MFRDKDKRVAFLGAGAVYDVGLPVTDELLNELKKFYDTNNCGNNTLKNEREYREFKHDLPQYQSMIAKIVRLSKAGIAHKDTHFDLEALFTFIDMAIAAKCVSKYTYTDDYLNFKKNFRKCLNEYFSWKAFYYQEQRKKVDNLSKNLSALINSTNTIITTNWDFMIEIEYLFQNVSLPKNIYGIPLLTKDPFFERMINKVKGCLGKTSGMDDSTTSKFQLYKLHGSIAWCSYNGKICFDRYSRSLLGLEGPTDGMADGNLLIYPSYIKQINNQIMSEIWSQAHKALQKGEVIEIVGYSLPEADQAIRSMLLSVHNCGKEIRVVNKSKDEKNKAEIRKKWRDFFGDDVRFCFHGAQKYYEECIHKQKCD